MILGQLRKERAVPKYYDFEVSLCEVTPRIWRRLLIPSTAKFSDLHLAIQEASGWWNYHLYAFRETPEWGREGIIAGIPDKLYPPGWKRSAGPRFESSWEHSVLSGVEASCRT